jgi:hypothetical protein
MATPTVVMAKFSDFAARIRFLAGLEEASRVTLFHVNPTPTVWQVCWDWHLIETKLDKPTRLTRDGIIQPGRINRAAVDILELDLIPVEEVEWGTGRSGRAWSIVGRIGPTRWTMTPLSAVIDHPLDTPGDLEDVPFTSSMCAKLRGHGGALVTST